mgnify:CR=1 FL=1
MGGSSIFHWIVLLLLLAVYFIPTYVAYKRNHRNKVPILVVNILFGWTLIGWGGALAWAFFNQKV